MSGNAKLKVTPVEGKPKPDGGWDVKPLHKRDSVVAYHDARVALRRGGLTYVRTRDKAVREQLAKRPLFAAALLEDPDYMLKEGAKPKLRDVVRVQYTAHIDPDIDPPRQVFEFIEVPVDKAVPVDIKQAVFLLNPEQWGLLFEECLPDGSVPDLSEIAAEEPRREPKKPGGR